MNTFPEFLFFCDTIRSIGFYWNSPLSLKSSTYHITYSFSSSSNYYYYKYVHFTSVVISRFMDEKLPEILKKYLVYYVQIRSMPWSYFFFEYSFLFLWIWHGYNYNSHYKYDSMPRLTICSFFGGKVLHFRIIFHLVFFSFFFWFCSRVYHQADVRFNLYAAVAWSIPTSFKQ